MRPLVTDGVAWSVWLSVYVDLSQLSALQKLRKRLRCRLSYRWGGPDSPFWRGSFEGGSLAHCGWTDWDAIWVVDSGGSKEACVRWGVHIGATWRIRLNRLCATALWPFCQIILTVWWIFRWYSVYDGILEVQLNHAQSRCKAPAYAAVDRVWHLYLYIPTYLWRYAKCNKEWCRSVKSTYNWGKYWGSPLMEWRWLPVVSGWWWWGLIDRFLW